MAPATIRADRAHAGFLSTPTNSASTGSEEWRQLEAQREGMYSPRRQSGLHLAMCRSARNGVALPPLLAPCSGIVWFLQFFHFLINQSASFTEPSRRLWWLRVAWSHAPAIRRHRSHPPRTRAATRPQRRAPVASVSCARAHCLPLSRPLHRSGRRPSPTPC